ncbi:MAG: YkvA family protein [Ilumatobacteraceae bacterium]
MLRWLIIAAAVVAASWIVMIVLARRLPPGLAKDLATVLPSCVTTARRLRKDPRVPRRVKVAVGFAGLWVLSPIDLIPEFLPVIGPLDDIVVVALALRYAARRIPPEALIEAWPGERRILERLAPATAAV